MTTKQVSHSLASKPFIALQWAFLIIAAVLLAPKHVWAASYYVATTGSNTNTGTSVTAPFQTIQQAMNVAVAGDTVYVRAGVYRETVTANHAGSAGKYITVTGYNGEVPVIKGSDVVTGWTLYSGSIWKKTGWTVRSQQVFMDFNDAQPTKPLQQIGMPNTFYGSFEYPKPVGSGVSTMVPGSFYYDPTATTLYVWLPDGSDPNKHTMEVSTRQRTVMMNQPYIYLKGLAFRHSNSSGFVKQGASIEMSGNSVIDQCDIQYMDFAGVIMGYLQSGAQLINSNVSNNGDSGVNAPGSYNFRVAGVTMNGNNYRNFYQLWHAGGLKATTKAYGVVEFNEVANNNGSGIWFDYANGGNALVIRNNYVHDNGPLEAAIFLEVSKNAQVYNNVIANNQRRGIYVSASDNSSIYNNTVYGTGNYSAIEMGGMPRTGATLTNNAIFNNIISNSTSKYDLFVATPDGTTIYGNTANYNDYYRSTGAIQLYLGTMYSDLGAWRTATKLDANSQTLNPSFVAPTSTTKAAANYALSSLSTIIDKGTTLSLVPQDYMKTPRPAGAAYDIGAFEYVSSTSTTSTSTSSTSTSTTTTKDTTPPTVTISNPADGAKVSGSVAIGASATDNVKVTSMSLYVDGVLKTRSTSGQISYSWSTSGVRIGTHYIWVSAVDAANNLSKITRSVTVQ